MAKRLEGSGEHGFERLAVFALALEFVAWGERVSLQLERRRRSLNRQLQRAIDSVLANIGEAGTEYSLGDKIRLFRYAVRSNGEASALIHGAEKISILTPAQIDEGKRLSLSLRIKLLRLIRSIAARRPQPPP